MSAISLSPNKTKTLDVRVTAIEQSVNDLQYDPINNILYNVASERLNAINTSLKNNIDSLLNLTNRVYEIDVSVKRFGAVGNANYKKEDGTWWVDAAFTIAAHDDTEAILQAVEYAKQNGGNINFPTCSGSYILSSTIVAYQGISITGNRKKSKVEYTGTGYAIQIDKIGTSWDTWITDFTITGLEIEGTANADFIKIDNGYKGQISLCKVYGFRNVIDLQYGWSIDFLGNQFVENLNNAIWFNPYTGGCINAIKILYNFIENNDNGIVIGNGFSTGFTSKYAGNTCYIKYNVIQANHTTQIDVSEYIGCYIEDNYTEASNKKDNQYVFIIGRQGDTVSKNITFKNNTTSEHYAYTSIPMKILKVNGLDIDDNTFWNSKGLYDIEIPDTAIVSNAYFKEANIKYVSTENIKGFSILDNNNKLARVMSLYPTLGTGWSKQGAQPIVIRKYNTVYLQGYLFTTNLTSVTLFTLPTGLRPKEDKWYLSPCYRDGTSTYASSNIILKVSASTGAVTVRSTITTDGTFPANTAVYCYLDVACFQLDY